MWVIPVGSMIFVVVVFVIVFLCFFDYFIVFLCMVLVVSGVGSTVSALSFDYSATYLAMGTADGNVRVAVVKDWSEPLVS